MPQSAHPPLAVGLAPTPRELGFLREDMPAARSVLLCSLVSVLGVVVPNKMEWLFYYLMLSKIKGS